MSKGLSSYPPLPRRRCNACGAFSDTSAGKQNQYSSFQETSGKTYVVYEWVGWLSNSGFPPDLALEIHPDSQRFIYLGDDAAVTLDIPAKQIRISGLRSAARSLFMIR